MPPPRTVRAGSGFGLVSLDDACVIAVKRRAARIAAADRHHMLLLPVCGCRCPCRSRQPRRAAHSWQRLCRRDVCCPWPHGGRCKCLLISAQNASCKLEPEREENPNCPPLVKSARERLPAGAWTGAFASICRLSVFAAKSITFARLKRGRCRCLALPRCCGASELCGAIPRRRLCKGGSATAGTSNAQEQGAVSTLR